MNTHFHGKTVMITGAGGSIGSELALRVFRRNPKNLLLVGHSEQPLYDLLQTFSYERQRPDTVVTAHLASVADERAMEQLIPGVDIVIHAAAHKHVPLCEQNPVEAVKNNVGGFMTLANVASRYGVKQVILVSSDKAVKPSSVMGATKRACELYAKFLGARSSTKFTIVRFGNVRDSSGSVMPLWRKQIAAGGPVTVTDKRCTRFFMSIPAACALVIEAAAQRAGTYMLDMGKPQSVAGLAQVLIDTEIDKWRCANPGLQSPKIEIVETGLRPGEKLEEELQYDGEAVLTHVRGLLRLKENDSGRVTRWADFHDLINATMCVGGKDLVLRRLWEIVS